MADMPALLPGWMVLDPVDELCCCAMRACNSSFRFQGLALSVSSDIVYNSTALGSRLCFIQVVTAGQCSSLSRQYLACHMAGCVPHW